VAAMTSALDEKWRPFNCFFSQETGGSPTGLDPENGVGDQDTGSPGRPVSSGLQVPGEPGHCHARTRPPLHQTTGTIDVFDPRSDISGHTSRRAFACPNLHE